MHSVGFDPPSQSFSNFTVHMHSPGDLVKLRILNDWEWPDGHDPPFAQLSSR